MQYAAPSAVYRGNEDRALSNSRDALGVIPGDCGKHDVVTQLDAGHKAEGVYQVHTRAGVGDPFGSLAAVIGCQLFPWCVDNLKCVRLRPGSVPRVVRSDGRAGGQGGQGRTRGVVSLRLVGVHWVGGDEAVVRAAVHADVVVGSNLGRLRQVWKEEGFQLLVCEEGRVESGRRRDVRVGRRWRLHVDRLWHDRSGECHGLGPRQHLTDCGGWDDRHLGVERRQAQSATSPITEALSAERAH